jgi:glyoxylase-like metal-dependent hydrolase (beta-lactamase superfamily II)
MKFWKTKSGCTIIKVLSGRSNVFLFSDKGKKILIDTGTRMGWKKLSARLKRLGITRLDFLILTHTHFDHAENAGKIKKVFGAKVIVNKEEASYLETGRNTIPDGTNFFTHFLVKTLAPALSFKLSYEPCIADIIVHKKFDLNDDGINCYIIHTPGHSPGSQSIIVDNEIALVGDAMFGIFPRSVFPPFADNPDMMINSWGRLLDTGCNLFLPSHGTANKAELLKAEYLKKTGSLQK